jgi:hypothetical protein
MRPASNHIRLVVLALVLACPIGPFSVNAGESGSCVPVFIPSGIDPGAHDLYHNVLRPGWSHPREACAYHRLIRRREVDLRGQTCA